MIKNYFFGDNITHTENIFSLKEFVYFLQNNATNCDFESDYFSKVIAPFFTNIDTVHSINFILNDFFYENIKKVDHSINSIVDLVKSLPDSIEINFSCSKDNIEYILLSRLKDENIKYIVDDVHTPSKIHLSKKTILPKDYSVSIYGSCDSRDIFRVYKEIHGDLFNVPFYISNVSVASLLSLSFEFKDSLIKAKSPFLTECVKNDLKKDSFKKIIKSLPDCNFLVLDFMDERFDILVKNNSLITNSWSFRSTELANLVTVDSIIEFDSDEKLILTYSALDELITAASKVKKMKDIVINKVYMVGFYYDGYKIIKFEDRKYNINRFNEFVRKIYKYLEDKYPNLTYLSTPEYFNFCDYRHQWGVHPYHYNNIFYLNRAKMITRINKE